MSEQINKVLASTAQAFTTAEQKQARDNIAAQASGDYAFNSSLSAKQDTSAMSSYLPYSAISADGNSAITSINGSSVGSFSGVSSNNNVTGNGTSGSPIGLSSRIEFPSSNSGAAVGHRGMLVSSNNHTAWYYGAFASFEAATASANYRASEAEFSNASGTAVVNKSSIDRWNSLGVENLTMFGDDYPIASANTVETGYNWVKRTISATGLPALPLYGFGSLPSYQMNVVGSGGNFLKYEPPYSAIYLSGDETDYNSSYLPAGVTWPMRVDVWNLSNHDVNITTDTFHGATSDFHHGDSATIWYIPALSRWSDMANI